MTASTRQSYEQTLFDECVIRVLVLERLEPDPSERILILKVYTYRLQLTAYFAFPQGAKPTTWTVVESANLPIPSVSSKNPTSGEKSILPREQIRPFLEALLLHTRNMLEEALSDYQWNVYDDPARLHAQEALYNVPPLLD